MKLAVAALAAVFLAAGCGAPTGTADTGFREYISGYFCKRTADGVFGHIDLTEELWEDGHFATIKVKWKMASQASFAIAPPGGTKIGAPELAVDFYTADDHSAPQLSGALATLEVAPIIYDTLFLYATLDGGTQTLMPRFNGLQYIFDSKFIAELKSAKNVRFDLMRQDGSQLARVNMNLSGMAEGFATVARLEAEARAAALDYKNRCDANITFDLRM